MNLHGAFRRSISTMSGPTSNVSPFTRAVVSTMRRIYPEKLADNSFDNTGLLLEAPHRPHLKNSLLLTIDLTKAVADEAIANKNSIIIAYHPIIFRPLKFLTQGNSQQDSLLRLAQEGISVYCPHTALDAAPRGLNDWLVSIVTGQVLAQNDRTHKPASCTTRPIIPIKEPPPGFENAGYGRIVHFTQPQPLSEILHRITTSLSLPHVSIATPQSIPASQKAQIPISSIGLCAGSGGSMLGNLDVDLLFTGELSHHEALAATEQGKVVITTFHSNSERGFLKEMRSYLGGEIFNEVTEQYERGDGGWAIDPEDREIVLQLSEVDRDPFEIVGAN